MHQKSLERLGKSGWEPSMAQFVPLGAPHTATVPGTSMRSTVMGRRQGGVCIPLGRLHLLPPSSLRPCLGGRYLLSQPCSRAPFLGGSRQQQVPPIIGALRPNRGWSSNPQPREHRKPGPAPSFWHPGTFVCLFSAFSLLVRGIGILDAVCRAPAAVRPCIPLRHRLGFFKTLAHF